MGSFYDFSGGSSSDKFLLDNGISGGSTTKSITHLNKYKFRYPEHVLTNMTGYLFFVRPRLNFSNEENLERPEFQIYLRNSMGNKNKIIFDILNTDSMALGGRDTFINIITNYATSFDVTDESIKNIASNETLTGWSIQYGSDHHESLGPNSFTVNYYDNRDLLLYNIHKVWKDYISLIKFGIIVPSDYNRDRFILDYATTAYYIVVAEDGHTILFFTAYFGVFPMNLPSNVFSTSLGDNKTLPNYSIQYQYSMKDTDLNILTLNDFNEVSNRSRAIPDDRTVINRVDLLKHTNSYDQILPETWAKSPLITYNENTDKYHLRFLK